MCTWIYACTAAGGTSGGAGAEPPPGAIVIIAVSGRKLPDARYTPIQYIICYTTIILNYTI